MVILPAQQQPNNRADCCVTVAIPSQVLPVGARSALTGFTTKEGQGKEVLGASLLTVIYSSLSDHKAAKLQTTPNKSDGKHQNQ